MADASRICYLILACLVATHCGPRFAASAQASFAIDREDQLGSMPQSEHFQLVKLAEGVWVAAHNNVGYAISNAGIVDLGDRTLVFDTFLTPEAASDLRDAAETLTGRTTTLVVNSHFHNDHIRGNQVFAPEAQIISSSFTRAAIEKWEPEQIDYEREHAPERLEEFRQRSTDAGQKELPEIEMWIGYYEGMIRSHSTLETTLPTSTLDGVLEIRGSSRSAVLRTMGPGHTEDDVVLHLTSERIAFLGDLLFVDRHPWLGDGSPVEWVKTLREIHGWDLETVVPGHGPASPAQTLLTMADYIERLAMLVQAHVTDDGSAETVTDLPLPEEYNQWWYGRFFEPNLRFLHAVKSEANSREN